MNSWELTKKKKKKLERVNKEEEMVRALEELNEFRDLGELEG